MGHTMVVEISIQPDDIQETGMWPPVENGTHYDLEDAARAAASRPAALTAQEAIGPQLEGTGWHVVIPDE
jgi:hypothetical protein